MLKKRVLLVVVATLALSFGTLHSRAFASGRTLRFLSYNVWGLPGPLLRLPNRFTDIQRLVPWRGFDIVGFEETFDKRAQILQRLDGMPFVAWGPRGKFLRRFNSGLLLVSRWPILKTATMTYDYCAGADCFSNKGALFARIDVADVGEIDVVITHDNASQMVGLREEQMRELVEFIRKNHQDRSVPLILMGDLNDIPGSPAIQLIQSVLGLRDSHVEYVDAHPELPQLDRDGYTSDPRRNPNTTRGNPPKRIDYVLIDADPSRVETEQSGLAFDAPVHGEFLSDHFGVTAELHFESGEAGPPEDALVSPP